MVLPISHHVFNQKSEALNGPTPPPLPRKPDALMRCSASAPEISSRTSLLKHISILCECRKKIDLISFNRILALCILIIFSQTYSLYFIFLRNDSYIICMHDRLVKLVEGTMHEMFTCRRYTWSAYSGLDLLIYFNKVFFEKFRKINEAILGILDCETIQLSV